MAEIESHIACIVDTLKNILHPVQVRTFWLIATLMQIIICIDGMSIVWYFQIICS